MRPLRFPLLATALAATSAAGPARPAPAVTAIEVPQGAAVVIDGRMDEAEWRASTVHEVADGVTIRLQHAAGGLFVGIASVRRAFASACVAHGDAVRVLHASAALGSVGYAREGESWVTRETKFVYGMRNPELTAAARAERSEYLARHGWVASTTRMGDGRVQELQISRERIAGLTGLAVALYLPAGDSGAVIAWPATAAADGCARRAVGGRLPTGAAGVRAEEVAAVDVRALKPVAPPPAPSGDEEKPAMKMKAYASFDDYLDAQSPENQAIIRALRQFVRRTAPGLTEAVKWGNGCWVGKNGPVAYVYSDTEYVQFGFFNGASLKDPKGLLEGKGQYVRHMKVRDRSSIDERAFAALLRQATRSRG